MNNTENTREYEILLDVVRQSYASVVWTHKIQEKQKIVIFLTRNPLRPVPWGSIIRAVTFAHTGWARPGLGRFTYERI